MDDCGPPQAAASPLAASAGTAGHARSESAASVTSVPQHLQPTARADSGWDSSLMGTTHSSAVNAVAAAAASGEDRTMF